MRMRKVPWAVEYLEKSQRLEKEPAKWKGKWRSHLNTKDLHVEIGCGKGQYSLDMAKMYPESGFIAIEKNESAGGIAAKKFDEDPAEKKLTLIVEDAADLGEWFKEGEVDVIHLNFSDPWPKKRYAKRRLSSDSFIRQYLQVLSDSGRIEMKTDNGALFEYSVLMFLEYGFRLKDFQVDFRKEEHPEDAITEYEEKFIEKGQPIYRAVFQKK